MADMQAADIGHGEVQNWWGIDGCYAGWVCIGLGDGDAWQARVYGRGAEEGEDSVDFKRLMAERLESW